MFHLKHFGMIAARGKSPTHSCKQKTSIQIFRIYTLEQFSQLKVYELPLKVLDENFIVENAIIKNFSPELLKSPIKVPF